MRTQLFCLISALGLVAAGGGCASKLKHELTNNAPAGAIEEVLDTSKVQFTDFSSGAVINLKDYMEAGGRDYVLLTFGSRSCAACNRKAYHLQNEVIGQHPLFLTAQGRRFEIIGVNTDTDPLQRLQGYLDQYPFIRWSDPSGLAMLNHFMPSGRRFSVPLTVMVSRTGIAWRILPDEQVSIDNLVARVEFTLGMRSEQPTTGGSTSGDDDGDGGDGSSSGNGTGGSGTGTATGGTGDTGGTTGPAATDLSVAAAGRFNRIEVVDCAGATTTLANAWGDPDFKFVSVVRGACDAACESQMAALSSVGAACATAGKSCAVASLFSQGPNETACATNHAYKGGDAFVSVFESFFDWSHHPVVDAGGALQMPDSSAPWLFGFARDGTLVFGAEGSVAANVLAQAVASPGFGAPARGPDFAFHANEGALGFATLRLQRKLTIVTAGVYLPPPCGSCIEELERWSEQDQLFDFCDKNTEDCQVFAVSRDYRPADQTPATFLDYIKRGTTGGTWQGLDGLGLPRVRVLVDPKVWSDATDDEFYGSYHEGYLTAKFPLPAVENNNARTVIYDREGKLLSVFTSTSNTGADPILAKVGELLGR